MQIKDAKKILNINPDLFDDEEVNPLELIQRDMFHKHINDRENKAIDTVLGLDVPFGSEYNTFRELLKRILVVKNPKNGNSMKYQSSGGNITTNTYRFIDEETGDKLTITFNSDAFYFEPKK